MSEHDWTKYTAAYPIMTEVGRTGLVTCLRCGAAIVLDPDIDSIDLHDKWHEREANNDDT